MKRLLARIGLSTAAAAVLAIANVPAANADPAYGSEDRCSEPVVFYDSVTVTTCTYKFWWDYGAHWSHRSKVKVYNKGQYGPVSVKPDIEVGLSVYFSGNTYVDAGTEKVILGDSVQDITPGTHVQGRATVSTYYWTKMTLGRPFP